MISILGGLGASVLWASATLTSSRAGKLIGSSSTLAWMMLVGLAVAAPLGLASGPVPALTPELAFWMFGSAAGSVVGLLFVYSGLRIGKVGVVAALASTEGAIAAVVSVATGEPMTLHVPPRAVRRRNPSTTSPLSVACPPKAQPMVSRRHSLSSSVARAGKSAIRSVERKLAS